MSDDAQAAADQDEIARVGRPRLYQEPRQRVEVHLPVSLVERMDAATDNRTTWIEAAIRQRLERDANQ